MQRECHPAPSGLDTLPQGVIVCDENGAVVFRNARAVALMGNRHGDAWPPRP